MAKLMNKMPKYDVVFGGGGDRGGDRGGEVRV